MLQLFLIVSTLFSDIVREDGMTLAPPLQFSVCNQLCSVVLILFAILLPHFEIRGWISGAYSSLTSKFGMKIFSDDWISIVVNCAAKIFYCTCLFLRYKNLLLPSKFVSLSSPSNNPPPLPSQISVSLRPPSIIVLLSSSLI